MKKPNPVDAVIAECERFLRSARELQNFKPEKTRVGEHALYSQPSPKLTGQVRRSSLDLTRKLAELRQAPLYDWLERNPNGQADR